MSDRGRDVVRYIAAVERGPEYGIVSYSAHDPFWRFQTLGPPTNADWIRAQWMDLSDPFENARAAFWYLRAKYGAGVS